jgi:lipopolysaccharide/colanic/teichoic acid biosynthesis glycosyltransferase
MRTQLASLKPCATSWREVGPMRSKRLVDVLAASLGLALLAPFWLATALLILLQDGGPVLFRQERIGRGGRPFLLWKFRTMRHLASGQLLTVAGDPRITLLGRFLRRTKLDELPQLWNVLRGEMSLVGPRPEVRRYVERYTCEQRRVLDLHPGITDPASLTYVDEERVLTGFADPELAYVERIMPEKIRLNLEYAAHATVLSDLALIVRTIAVVLRRVPELPRQAEEERSWLGKA